MTNKPRSASEVRITPSTITVDGVEFPVQHSLISMDHYWGAYNKSIRRITLSFEMVDGILYMDGFYDSLVVVDNRAAQLKSTPVSSDTVHFEVDRGVLGDIEIE